MFIIYGMPNCMWCDRAKALLKLNNFVPEYKDITDPFNFEEMRSLFPDAKTVPQIYDQELSFCVGGYEQLRDYLK